MPRQANPHQLQGIMLPQWCETIIQAPPPAQATEGTSECTRTWTFATLEGLPVRATTETEISSRPMRRWTAVSPSSRSRSRLGGLRAQRTVEISDSRTRRLTVASRWWRSRSRSRSRRRGQTPNARRRCRIRRNARLATAPKTRSARLGTSRPDVSVELAEAEAPPPQKAHGECAKRLCQSSRQCPSRRCMKSCPPETANTTTFPRRRVLRTVSRRFFMTLCKRSWLPGKANTASFPRRRVLRPSCLWELQWARRPCTHRQQALYDQQCSTTTATTTTTARSSSTPLTTKSAAAVVAWKLTSGKRPSWNRRGLAEPTLCNARRRLPSKCPRFRDRISRRQCCHFQMRMIWTTTCQSWRNLLRSLRTPTETIGTTWTLTTCWLSWDRSLRLQAARTMS